MSAPHSTRHCEEPKATRQSRARVSYTGLLRYARNDDKPISLEGSAG